MMRAVIYIRKRGGSPESSIPRQRSACRWLADTLGAEVSGEFVDLGRSAGSPDRPGLKGLLARLGRTHDIDYVIVQRMDRFDRSFADHLRITRAIVGAGAKLVSVDDYGDAAELMRGLMTAPADLHQLEEGEEEAA